MHSDGCWSSIVAAPNERAALRLTAQHDWLVACVLPAGHSGSHASDGDQQHTGRRRWLMWDDYARHAQNLADEYECSSQALDGADCLFFAGHGGPHRYAAPVGRDFPDDSPPPVLGPADHAAAEPRAADAVTADSAAGDSAPGNSAAGHSAPGDSAPGDSAPPSVQVPPLPPEEDTLTLSALDDLFAGMPTLKDLPQTDLLMFPDSSFHPAAPSWPTSRGSYVGEHHPPQPVPPQAVVSGPNRFEPSGMIIDVEPEEQAAAGSTAPGGHHAAAAQSSADPSAADRSAVGPPSGRRRRNEGEPAAVVGGALVQSRERSRHRAAVDESAEDGMLQIRPGPATVLTTPMVQVIASNWDPVRMGVPIARRSLAGYSDIESIAAVVEDAAARLRALPESEGNGEVAAALNGVATSLGRLSEVLRPRGRAD